MLPFYHFNILGVFVFLADLLSIKISFLTSEYFHSTLLKSTLKNSLEFFERTPLGRIINRFNQDIDSIEKTIPDSLKALVNSLLLIFCKLIVIIIILPLFILPSIVLIAVFVLSQVLNKIKCYRKINFKKIL